MMRWTYAKAARVLTIFLAAVICFGFTGLQVTRSWAGNSAPFAPGERLKFQLRWTLVPAGKAVMEVLPMKTIDGQQVYHFRLTADSNSFVDMFYKVRDRIDAYASAKMTHAVRYQKKQHEGETRRNVKVDFNWKEEKANFNDGNSDKTIDIVPGTFDPLSAFYYTRMLDLNKNGVIQCPVSDGKKCVTGMARVVKKETITILSGTYDTILIEPDLKHVGGVFEKEKNAKIKVWVTADERRIPVKIASKVAIGHFVGELMSIETGNS